jgi:NitT/TauT family transport system permease protein
MASIVWLLRLLRMRPSLLCGVGITAKVVTSFTLVYFILLVNTLAGSKNIDNDILSIARLMGATRRILLWKVILPSATSGF